jgi:hypothetical protein
MNALPTYNYSPLIYKDIVLRILYIDRKNITSTRDPCDAGDYVSVSEESVRACCGRCEEVYWVAERGNVPSALSASKQAPKNVQYGASDTRRG